MALTSMLISPGASLGDMDATLGHVKQPEEINEVTLDETQAAQII